MFCFLNILTNATKLRYYRKMDNFNIVLSKLKKDGHRITKLRRSIIYFFFKNKKPSSFSDINLFLEQESIKVNKTTIYRELYFLKKESIINEVQFFGERAKRHEISYGEHHHHLRCISCNNIKDIVLKDDLKSQEEEINKKMGFKVLEHSLEFSGICSKCC